MDYFFIPRRVARLQYMTARLPFTALDKYVVARYWDEGALPRLGWELFLGSMDGFAEWLLADNHISRQGHAVMRRPESPATASEPERMVQARWAQYEENLQAAQAAAHEDGQQARRKAEAQAEAEKPPAEHAAETRAAEAEQAPQAAQIPISADQDRVSAAASQQRPDAADNRRLVRYRPEEPTAPASSP